MFSRGHSKIFALATLTEKHKARRLLPATGYPVDV